MSTHAKKSASSSDRWMNCHGSIALSEKAPPKPPGPWAIEGTNAHSVLEKILKAFIHPKGDIQATAKLLRQSMPAAMVDHALQAVLEIDERAPYKADILCETKVDLSFVEAGMFGTVDCAIVELFGRLTVIDYKYGAGIPVDPEYNSQLIYYALGLAHLYDYNFVEVAIVIIQPRADHERGPVREWMTTVEELEKWRDKFAKAAQACNEPNAPLVAGDWCRFCPAASICPEISTRAMRDAEIEFEPVTGELSTPLVASSKQVANLPTMLDAASKLEYWIKELRAHAFHMLELGETIPGWKLVEKRGIRQWVDKSIAFENKCFDLYKSHAFEDPKLKSPAQLEKLGPGAKKFVQKYAKQISSGLTLVPDSDAREAVHQMEAEFTKIDTGISYDNLLTGEFEKVNTKATKTPTTQQKGKKKYGRSIF